MINESSALRARLNYRTSQSSALCSVRPARAGRRVGTETVILSNCFHPYDFIAFNLLEFRYFRQQVLWVTAGESVHTGTDRRRRDQSAPEGRAQMLLGVFYFTVKFYVENWISASGVQTRNPFSHTAYVKMTPVNLLTPEFVLRLQIKILNMFI